MSRTRHFKPAEGEIHGPTIRGELPPEDVRRLFESMESASFGYWHFCSYQYSEEMRKGMISVRDDVGLIEVDGSLVSRQIKPVYWSELWVPLFVIEHNSICVDLDPADSGCLGQIIRVSDDSQERRLVCNSVGEFCSLVVEKYEAGLLEYRDDGAGPELHEVEDSLGFLWGRTQMQPNYAFKPTAEQALRIDRGAARRGGLTRRYASTRSGCTIDKLSVFD